MKIHEYQAKEILRRFGVAVPRGHLALNPADAEAAARELLSSGSTVVVVKAQIHAGGRGKGGGVKLAKSAAQARELAEAMLGMKLVTHQTGPAGQPVHKVYVEEGCEIARELYLGITLDRVAGRNTFMASAEGGVEIEEVAAHSPEKILRAVIDPVVGLSGYQARDLAFGLNLSGPSVNKFVAFAQAMYKTYVETDASIVEINPLVITKSGDVIALDAKFNFDDNALYRHKDLAGLRDLDEEDSKETQAKEHDLSYIALEGNIGCMVNGAGLAMATMDIIKYAGGSPANFLDVGGGANAEQVKNAFRILLSDRNVRAVLINIFGGILRCDTLATGVVSAARELNVKVPIVVRMEGTNVEKGREVLQDSGFNFTVADGMKDAAEKVVRLAR